MIVVAALLCAALTYLMARVLLRPSRMGDGKALYLLGRVSPADLKLTFEEDVADVRDEASGGSPIRLTAWWLPTPGPSDRTIVILHGYGDAKVGGIAWAPTLLGLGWNVLAMDSRAHGEAQGIYSTAGYFERHDVEQSINQLRTARPKETRHVALFGVSLGAAVALATAERMPDLAAVVCESPFTDYPTAARLHGKRMGMPLEFLQPWSVKLAEKISGAKFSDVRPIDLATRVTCPLLVFHAGDDPLVSPEAVARFSDVLKTRRGLTKHVVVPHAVHTKTILADPEAYRATLERFLSESLSLGNAK